VDRTRGGGRLLVRGRTTRGQMLCRRLFEGILDKQDRLAVTDAHRRGHAPRGGVPWLARSFSSVSTRLRGRTKRTRSRTVAVASGTRPPCPRRRGLHPGDGFGPNPVPFETRLVLQSSRASPQRRRSTSGRCPSRSPARAQPCHTRPCPVNPRSWTRAPKEERRTPAPALLLCTADPESRAAGGRDLRRALPRDGEAIGKEKLAPGLKTLGGLQVTHSRFPPTGGPVVARPAELAPLPCAPAPFPSHRLQDVCRCRTPILPC